MDLGYEKREIVAGIAKFYAPQDLIGKKIIIVSNLKPAMMMGIESKGMLLASGDEIPNVIFAGDSAEIGSRVR